MSTRSRFAIAAASLAILALVAGPVSAGNYAEVDYSAGLEEPPAAGEERELRLVLMQHGVTPVNDGEVVVTAVLPGTDEVVSAAATPLGDGAWSASLTFPSAGDWQVRVTHSLLETPPAIDVAVAEGGIGWAAVASVGGMAAVAVVLVLVATGLARRRPPRAVAPSPVTPIEGSLHG
jgi:hypothetical protein